VTAGPSVTYLYQPVKFVNPTKSVFVRALEEAPGFRVVPLDECLRNPAALEGADVLLVDGVFHFTIWRGDRNEAYARVVDLVASAGRPTILVGLMDDPHGGGADARREYDRWRESGLFYLNIATSAQFLRTRVAFDREPWLDPVAWSTLNPELLGDRYLLFPACVSAGEFLPWDGRKLLDVNVLGARYYVRREAMRRLRGRGLRLVTSRNLGFRALSLLVGRYNRGLRPYQAAFRHVIHRSWLSVTCSGTVGYPVRKFFEVPALGSLLVAEFFDHPEALGFRDGENCVRLSADRVAEIPDVVGRLLRDKAEVRRLTRAGQETVRALHTAEVRVGQLREIASAVVNGSLRTTRWEAGRQVLVKRS
jgi:hypothetical protein